VEDDRPSGALVHFISLFGWFGEGAFESSCFVELTKQVEFVFQSMSFFVVGSSFFGQMQKGGFEHFPPFSLSLEHILLLAVNDEAT